MIQQLNELARCAGGQAFSFLFTLRRHETQKVYRWTASPGGHRFQSGGQADAAEVCSGPDLLDAFDTFVEEVELDARPEPVPEGHEVWRFVHASLEQQGGDPSLSGPMDALLDEAFNGPSLYDSRDLRRSTKG